MSKNHHRSSRLTGFAMVVMASGCGSLAMAACAAREARSPTVALPAEHQTMAATGEADLASRENADPVVQPAVGRKESTVAFQSVGTTGGAEDPALIRGGELYTKYCTICHGENGDGAGKFAYLMNPRPRDFTRGDFKLATTQNLIPNDEDLVRTIGRGMPGSAMPPWDHLPLVDLQALASYIRALHIQGTTGRLQQWVNEGSVKRDDLARMLAERTQPGPPLVVPAEPAFDEIQWFRGRRLYLENCASCHGADGQPVADAVKYDREGYPVAPRSFVQGIFKGGSDGHQLYARIWKGMKGTPMPASEGAYSGDETWDIIHYVQSLARTGAQERAQLRQGTFVASNAHGPLPTGPTDRAWEQARPLYVAMTPLWWTENRIEGLVVQALHNDEALAIKLSWIDSTQDSRAVKQTEFRDGVAIQFSLSSDPPFYMGDPSEHGGVNIWFWKADRSQDLAGGYQDVDAAFPDRAIDRYPEQQQPTSRTFSDWPRATLAGHDPLFITAWGAGNLVANPNLDTPVESLVAHGPGTLSGKPTNVQKVEGSAVYERGVWSVQMQRGMAFTERGHEGERIFKKGDYLPVSFAIWNGNAGDRDGKKNISIWQKLVIE